MCTGKEAYIGGSRESRESSEGEEVPPSWWELTYTQCADLLSLVAARGLAFVRMADEWIETGPAPGPVPRWARGRTPSMMTETERAAAVREHLVATFGERLGSELFAHEQSAEGVGSQISGAGTK